MHTYTISSAKGYNHVTCGYIFVVDIDMQALNIVTFSYSITQAHSGQQWSVLTITSSMAHTICTMYTNFPHAPVLKYHLVNKYKNKQLLLRS